VYPNSLTFTIPAIAPSLPTTSSATCRASRSPRTSRPSQPPARNSPTLNYESGKEYPLKKVVAPGVPLSYVVEKMKLNKDKTELTVNESLKLTGIPPKVFD